MGDEEQEVGVRQRGRYKKSTKMRFVLKQPPNPYVDESADESIIEEDESK